ncbi:MAG: alanine--tRNA ligase [Actinomycetota bacterium]
MQSAEIRSTFTDFFEARGHKRWPSSSLIPNDPTLLLTTAGMVQFKPYFLGEAVAEIPRATTVQKCARTTDIEKVGFTARHLTFFEMLGNFSFGDYFKPEVCPWAWELLTKHYGLPVDKLWVTVFDDDDEAFEIWTRQVGVAPDRVQRRGAEDNFWSMGVAGPCGPCSELYFDRGEAYGAGGGPAVGSEDRYLEVWNLVFMQSLRDDAGNILGELPRKNIDTGMGMERMAVVLQDVPTVYETDVMAPIVSCVSQVTGRGYGEDPRTDVSLRIVTDHARSASFLIADGVFPSNEERGYVLRRLLRRAVRHLRLLGVEHAVLPQVVGTVVDTLGEAWPELVKGRKLIEAVAGNEEEQFSHTLRQGTVLLEGAIERTKQAGSRVLSGEDAFRLHDTYGFPLDLTVEAAAEQGFEVDRDAFAVLMQEQRTRAKEAGRETRETAGAVEAFREVVATHGPTDFLGYQVTEAEGRILALVVAGEPVSAAGEGAEVEIALDRTPFYAESGGQVGDTGIIETASGARLDVVDVQHGIEGLSVHRARILGGEVRFGEDVTCVVNARRRAAIARSHTATHVLHWSLRHHLGEHAVQAGSLVEPGRLRFDFSHIGAVSKDQLAQIEAAVNERVSEDPSVHAYETSRSYAASIGAMALFGEKYGEIVRVVEVGDFSVELCGGTHVSHIAQIGVVKVLGESSIGSNLRRIEALTGLDALSYLNHEQAVLHEMTALLKAPPDQAVERLSRSLAALKAAEQELGRLRTAQLAVRAKELAASGSEEAGGRVVVAEATGLGMDELRKLALEVRATLDGLGGGVVVLGSADGSRANLVAVVGRAQRERGASARRILTEAAKVVGGGAGGKDELAMAGGSRAEGLADALGLASIQARSELAAATQGGR